jgi:hypothetical protein
MIKMFFKPLQGSFIQILKELSIATHENTKIIFGEK